MFKGHFPCNIYDSMASLMLHIPGECPWNISSMYLSYIPAVILGIFMGCFRKIVCQLGMYTTKKIDGNKSNRSRGFSCDSMKSFIKK